MKIFFFLYLVYINSFKIPELLPNTIMRAQKLSDEKFYMLKTDNLLPFTSYKIMIHYVGPV